MGANQSNSAGGGQSSRSLATGEVKTSYYELLGIEKQATEEEIKKAYRRRALELHPDRNYGNIEEATTLFAAVQTAYEVLSDPQERAWYDTHEEAILRDIDPEEAARDGAESQAAYERNLGVTSADDILRMLRKFNGGVEFNDEKEGFFGFLKEVFERLGKEEMVAMRREGSGSEVMEYPGFGSAQDQYEDVKEFYAVWAGFATRKSFAWRDKWRTADAPDRRTRRYIEKENQRLREEGIREFNDAVRTLVAFVRKRDPRYTSGVGSLLTEAEREKVLRDAAAERARKMRRENEEKMGLQAGEAVIPDWAKAEMLEREEHEGNLEEEGEESEEEQWECVACRKTFKSEKQFEAHEKSKKHVKSVEALKRKMRKEGVVLELDEEEEDKDQEVADGQSSAEEDNSMINGVAMPQKSREDSGAPYKNGIADTESPVDDIEDRVVHAVQASMEDLHIRNGNEHEDIPQPPHEDQKSHPEDVSSEDGHKSISDEEEDDLDDKSRTMRQSSDSEASSQQTPLSNTQPQTLGKAAQKRAKRAAAVDEQQSAAGALQHKCASCSAAFPSRSRLFQHIKDHGHAAPVAAGGPKGKAGKKGKGGKK